LAGQTQTGVKDGDLMHLIHLSFMSLAISLFVEEIVLRPLSFIRSMEQDLTA
jgi:hypothetical protein